MSTSLTYNVQVSTGNTNTSLEQVARGVDVVTQRVDGFKNTMGKIGAATFIFNNFAQSFDALSNTIGKAVEPGIKLDSSLQDLKAITGATDSQLKLIKQSAMESARAFGVDAANSVESYKLLLSQLTPELAKSPAALSAMGKNVGILSKQLGGDTAAAAGILTTAMNQYKVSLDDPIEATRTQAAMMNIMSAAAKEGSAELPAIKSALEAAGMTAKTFNVSFAETNAAIQVLDKAGKKGAEGGVAIRNILAEMGLGAKQPKAVSEAFKEMGIDLNKLSDQSLTFSERLQILKPAMNNQALITQLFGKENMAAAMALIDGAGEMDRYTNAIVGTNTAGEMAATVMDSYQEKINRIGAAFKNAGIHLFDFIKPAMPVLSVLGKTTKAIADVGGMINTVGILADSKFGAAMGKAATSTWGFVRAMFASSMSLLRAGVQYALTGAMIIGTFITSVVSATAAQLGLNIAMSANPIGLIVVGIAAAVGAVVLLVKHWDTIKTTLINFGKWIWQHHPFKWLIDVTDKIFPGFKKQMEDLWTWVKSKFEALVGWLKDAYSFIKKLFDTGADSSPTNFAFTPQAAIPGIDMPNAAQKNQAITGPGSMANSKELKDTSSSIAAGGNRPTNIYVTIGKFQDKIEVHSSTVEKGVDEIVRLIDERLLGILNSANSLSTR